MRNSKLSSTPRHGWWHTTKVYLRECWKLCQNTTKRKGWTFSRSSFLVACGAQENQMRKLKSFSHVWIHQDKHKRASLPPTRTGRSFSTVWLILRPYGQWIRLQSFVRSTQMSPTMLLWPNVPSLHSETVKMKKRWLDQEWSTASSELIPDLRKKNS